LFLNLLQHGIGKSVEDLRWNYTIDQVYLFNTKLCRKSMDDLRENAFVLANALVYASPSYDEAAGRKKQKSWNEFINSLDWRKVSKKVNKKKSPMAFANDLRRFKVGVK